MGHHKTEYKVQYKVQCKLLLQQLLDGKALTAAQSRQMLAMMISGQLAPEWLAALLVALQGKGITQAELLGAVHAMRAAMHPVPVADQQHLIDTCGTGGDAAGIFNVSTASALVAAAAGARVAKHGNRSVSSMTGSADLLQEIGVKLDLTTEQVQQCLVQTGIAFLFAPQFHPAMKHVAAVRQSLGIKTLFNLLGPLVNPAGVLRQVIGVYHPAFMPLFAEVLRTFSSQHVLLLHAQDGLDEISIAAPTRATELNQGTIRTYQIQPDDFGLPTGTLEQIKVQSAAQSARLMRAALGDAEARAFVTAGQMQAAVQAIALNAGAAIYVAGLAADLAAGIRQAQCCLQEGRAHTKMQEFVACTRSFI